MPRQYAENTKVPAYQTQAEIKDMLKKKGATRMAVKE